MKLQKQLNIILTAILSLGFILAGIFIFSSSYMRTFEALTDLCGAFKFYFCILFGIPVEDLPNVVNYSKVIEWTAILPEDFVAFKDNTITYASLLISKENFLSWLVSAGDVTSKIAKILIILLPCFLVLGITIKRLYAQTNTKYNENTLPLKVFKKVSEKTFQPVKKFICGYAEFLKEHNYIWILWLTMWVNAKVDKTCRV